MKGHIKKLSKEELALKIGARIKELREVKGISQAELARRCDKDRQHMEKIENGKVSVNLYTLHIVAVALDCTLSDIANVQ